MKNIFFGPVGTSFQEWGVRSLQNIERWINTLTEFRGATALRDGADGLVPQPKIGDQVKFLCGDGTFKTVSGGGGGSTTFLGLTDTPDAYTGAGGMHVTVKTDLSGLEFTAAAGGGNVTAVPTPLNNQVAIWTGATTIEGDPNFYYDSATQSLTINTTTPTTNLRLISTDPGTLGPGLQFFHISPSPAVNDQIGNFGFYGNNAAGSSTPYVFMVAQLGDPTVGTEDGNYQIYLMKNGALTLMSTMSASGLTVVGNVFVTDEAYGVSWDGSSAVPTKNAVYDKIQTLGAGGSGDVVGPGSATDNAVARFDTTTGKLIQNSLTTISDTGTLATPIVTVNDDPYAAGWDGSTQVPTKNAIYDKIQTLGGGGNVSNVGTPVNNQLAIWTDATHVEGDPNLTYDATALTVKSTAAGSYVYVAHSNDAGAVGPLFQFYHNSPSPAVSDVPGSVDFWGNNSVGTKVGYGAFQVVITDPTAGSEDSAWSVYLQKAGVFGIRAQLDGNGFTVLGNVFVTDEAYGATWDGSTAVPTKNAVYDKIQSMAAGGGGNVSNVGTPVDNQIAIWTTSTNIEGDPDFTYDTTTNILALTGTMVITQSGGVTNLRLTSADAGTVGPVMDFYHGSPSPAVNDVVAVINCFGNNSAAVLKQYGNITLAIDDPVAGTEDATWRFYGMKAGTSTNLIAISGVGLTSFFDVFTTDEAYGVSWNGSTAVPTKNAVYDKIETLGSGGGAGAAKCWGRVTVSGGVPTLAANLNVTSITDTAVGRLTVTIGTDFASADYCVVASYAYVDSGSANYVPHVNATIGLSAGSFELLAENSSGVNFDITEYYWACFGT